MDFKTIGAAVGGVMSIGAVAFLGLRALESPAQPQPSRRSLSTAAAQAAPVPSAAADAGPLVLAPPGGLRLLRYTHANCGIGAMDADGGMRPIGDAGTDGGAALAAVQCEYPDGGVAWTIPAIQERGVRSAYLMARLIAVDLVRDPGRVRRELASMDREAARGDDHWILPGLMFRAPDRARGRLVRLEGTAERVGERDGETHLTISLDLHGRERIQVMYPGIASDRVVNGAYVVVYGVANGAHSDERLGAPVVVPGVIAVHIEPQAEGDVEEQNRRLMRRLRHR